MLEFRVSDFSSPLRLGLISVANACAWSIIDCSVLSITRFGSVADKKKGTGVMSSRSAAQGQLTRTIRLVTIPAEHGGWAFALQPVLLGMLVAPSVAGVWLGLATLAVFLARQPVKLILADLRAGKRYSRTVWAERFALLYGWVAVGAVTLAFLTASGPFWLPIIAAVPVALVQTYFDMLRQSRALLAELAGAVAMGAAASAVALAGNWPLGPSFVLWTALAISAVTSIVYVRTRFRIERTGDGPIGVALALQAFGLLVAVVIVVLDVLPWLAAIAIGILAVRAVWGLSPWHKRVKAQFVGIQELVFGLLTVALVAAGYMMSM